MDRKRDASAVPSDKAFLSQRSPLSPTKKGSHPRVLVVDDEAVIADTLAEILCRSGFASIAAYDAAEALEMALLWPPELLITDVSLPKMSGVELAITIKRVYPECKILLFTGRASAAELVYSAQRTGHAFTLLSKPVPPRDLLALVAERLGAGGSAQAAATA
jgi:CheY-like chemotaxis protein